MSKVNVIRKRKVIPVVPAKESFDINGDYSDTDGTVRIIKTNGDTVFEFGLNMTQYCCGIIEIGNLYLRSNSVIESETFKKNLLKR